MQIQNLIKALCTSRAFMWQLTASQWFSPWDQYSVGLSHRYLTLWLVLHRCYIACWSSLSSDKGFSPHNFQKDQTFFSSPQALHATIGVGFLLSTLLVQPFLPSLEEHSRYLPSHFSNHILWSRHPGYISSWLSILGRPSVIWTQRRRRGLLSTWWKALSGLF